MTLCRLVILGLLTLIGKSSFCQHDSLISYATHIKLGMQSSQADSVMPFSLVNMHKVPGGTWRYIYENVYQSTATYKDKSWNGYTFRMLYNNDKLIYFDLVTDATQKPLYSQTDSISIKQTIDRFNHEFDAKESFSAIIKSFYTNVYGLNEPLNNFFSSASIKSKSSLLNYAKSLCPEYSASAIIRILEIEKIKPFLSLNEKLLLNKIVSLDRQIQFMIGDVYQRVTFSDFLKKYEPELQNVLK